MCGGVPYIAKGKPFQKSFQIAANIIIGVITLPRPQERTQRLTGANRGRFGWGRYHYPRCALCAFETPDGRWSRVHTLPFYACCRRPIDAAIFVSNKLQIRCLQVGVLPLPSERATRSQTSPARVFKRRTLPFFCVRGGVHERKAERLQNGDAHGTRLRSEAPRPRRAALLRCCCSRRAERLHGFHALCCADSFACTLCRSTALSSAVNCRS